MPVSSLFDGEAQKPMRASVWQNRPAANAEAGSEISPSVVVSHIAARGSTILELPTACGRLVKSAVTLASGPSVSALSAANTLETDSSGISPEASTIVARSMASRYSTDASFQRSALASTFSAYRSVRGAPLPRATHHACGYRRHAPVTQPERRSAIGAALAKSTLLDGRR
ncbi:hypothetical protein [Burkholderia sp. Nafp2/4-1b]|uniref:hypothetical protein n=1 Tax=Burkholderia sp. Nafp2/4-1b TaxID=2116686 RepID=UPI001969A95D|nr:hypothetical protein [Burkholderia sp. Nafp2/4-1b]